MCALRAAMLQTPEFLCSDAFQLCVYTRLCEWPSWPSDEILSLLPASRQHKHMRLATSHESNRKPTKGKNKKIKERSK